MRPDGDALGSQIAMGSSLRKLGKKVKVWNEEGLLEKYCFLPGGELVETAAYEPEDFDVVLALDTATRQRLGDNVLRSGRPARRSGSTSIIIRAIPRYGDLVYIDPIAPATGQILFELLQSQDLPIDAGDRGESVRRHLDRHRFFPISEHDRAHFRDRQPNCCVAASMSARVSQMLYESYPRRRIELLRELLGTHAFRRRRQSREFQPAVWQLPHELGRIPEDNEGLIDHLRAIQGVIVAVFLRRTAPRAKCA